MFMAPPDKPISRHEKSVLNARNTEQHLVFKDKSDMNRFCSALTRRIKLFVKTVTKSLKQFPDGSSDALSAFKPCLKTVYRTVIF